MAGSIDTNSDGGSYYQLLLQGIILVVSVLVGMLSGILKLVPRDAIGMLNKFIFNVPLPFLIFMVLRDTNLSVVDWLYALQFFCVIVFSLVLLGMWTKFVQKGGILEYMENILAGTLTNTAVYALPIVTALYGTANTFYVIIAMLLEIALQFPIAFVLLAAAQISIESSASDTSDLPSNESNRKEVLKNIKTVILNVLKTASIWGFILGIVWTSAFGPKFSPFVIASIVDPIGRSFTPCALLSIGLFAYDVLMTWKESRRQSKGLKNKHSMSKTSEKVVPTDPRESGSGSRPSQCSSHDNTIEMDTVNKNGNELAGDELNVPKHSKSLARKIFLLSLFKHLGFPLMSLPIILLFNPPPLQARITLVVTACPVAVTAFVMTAQAKFAQQSAKIMTLTIIISCFGSIPAIMLVLFCLDAMKLWAL